MNLILSIDDIVNLRAKVTEKCPAVKLSEENSVKEVETLRSGSPRQDNEIQRLQDT